MLICMGLGALFAIGAKGPLAALMTLLLPPDHELCTDGDSVFDLCWLCRYALMLICMGLGALFANGATGPLAALMTLLLPPEIKSFALSVFEFVAFLLGPAYSVIMGVGLQVCPCLT